MKPRIRFKGYTDAWEQRKFKETVLIERGGSPRPIDDYITDQDNGLNWIKIGDAPAMGNHITQTAEKIRPEGLSKTREVYPGDLILSNSMSFGKPYIMGIYGCIHDGWLLIRNEKGVFDLIFLCHLLGTKQMFVQYQSLAAGSTVNNLNKELVGGTVVKYPSIQEQQTVGAFFNKLDNLITLHQRKYDKIVSIKKALLEKMFPSDAETAPKIRFKGFTDAWEQREFNSIAKRVTEMAAIVGLPRVEYEDIVSGQGTLNKDIYKKKSNKAGILFNDGDVLFGKLRPYLKNWLFASFKGVAVGDFWVLRAENADGQYIYTLLQIDAFQDVANQSTGTKMPRADWSLVSKQQFFTPRSVAEQRKIGIVFKQLDNLITLHQRQLEKLKNIKSALLEKMFV